MLSQVANAYRPMAVGIYPGLVTEVTVGNVYLVSVSDHEECDC